MISRKGFSVSDIVLILSVSLFTSSLVSSDNGNQNSKQDSNEESNNDNQEQGQGQEQKEEKEESKDDDEYRQPPPYEDLYCGHMNCYDLLGVTRLN